MKSNNLGRGCRFDVTFDVHCASEIRACVLEPAVVSSMVSLNVLVHDIPDT